MSKREELADAIAALLNSENNSYSMAFEAKRRAMPYVERKDLKSVGVTVLAGTKTSERRTRGAFGHTYKPVVSVHGNVTGADEAARLASLGQYLTLVEEIEGVFEELEEPLAELGFIGFDESDAEREAYDQESARDGVFHTNITLEFQD